METTSNLVKKHISKKEDILIGTLILGILVEMWLRKLYKIISKILNELHKYGKTLCILYIVLL